MDILNISAQEWITKEEESLKRLLEQEIWDRVPLINSNDLQSFKDGMLVRFRGMIQDMYDPEYYMEHFEVLNEKTNEKCTRYGKYCDAVVSNKDERVELYSSVNKHSERQTYVVTCIPGINAWVQQYECEKYRLPKPQEQPQASTTSQNKRGFDDIMEVEDTVENTSTNSSFKKISHGQNKDSEKAGGLVVSPEHILNHPLGNKKSKVCHVRVYKEFETLKLNDMCEFVGFLSVNPVMEALFHDDEENFESKMEIQTHHPPSSLVPRIHVVHFRSMSHNNPLVDNVLNTNVNNLENIKKEVLIVLSQLLLGDSLAAEYLICHLISEVYSRIDFMPLGKFTLNFSNIPKLQNTDYVADLYNILETLVTKSHYLPLTLENMNTLAFTPKKDYECNRLTSGILQLSQNTLLVLDETKLQEGNLDTAGVQGVKSLANAIKTQKVSYDFNYYPIEFECNIRFLVFSEGKSMLPSDVHIPLKPDKVCLDTFSEILEAARHFLKPELLEEIRKYFTQARLIKYKLSEQVQELVQEEFVSMRNSSSNVTAADLHSLLVLARLICLSEGKDTLDASCWKKACQMEKERKARIPK